jgi:hypothetical protein
MIFDEFLKAGLIPIGGDDEIYKKLVTASKKLEEVLKTDKSKVISYTLVAIDSNITENEPVLLEVENIVTDEWKLIRSQFTEMPIAIYRGIILQALEELGKTDSNIAAIIWHSGSSPFPLLKKKTKESDILFNFLHLMGDISEETAVAEWSLNEEDPKIKLPVLKINGLKLGNVTINSNNLKAKLNVAANRSPQGHNQYQHPAEWAEHFSQNATEGIATAFQTSFEEFNKSLSPTAIEEPINKFFIEFKKTLDNSLKITFSTLIAVERRSKLIWWKEGLYSQSLRKSYRELDEFESSIAMAYDLYNLLPLHCPTSVEYILKETYNVIPRKKKKIKILDFVMTAKSKDKKEFIEKFIEKKDTIGRTDITIINDINFCV